MIFLHGLAQQWGRKINKILHKSSLGDEDDARTSNTCIAQRKHAIPHCMMTNNLRNIIECYNNTHQGAPHTPTCAYASDLGDSQSRCLLIKYDQFDHHNSCYY